MLWPGESNPVVVPVPGHKFTYAVGHCSGGTVSEVSFEMGYIGKGKRHVTRLHWKVFSIRFDPKFVLDGIDELLQSDRIGVADVIDPVTVSG
jgi:hypothetical protein